MAPRWYAQAASPITRRRLVLPVLVMAPRRTLLPVVSRLRIPVERSARRHARARGGPGELPVQAVTVRTRLVTEPQPTGRPELLDQALHKSAVLGIVPSDVPPPRQNRPPRPLLARSRCPETRNATLAALHTVEVVGSNPTAPTIRTNGTSYVRSLPSLPGCQL